MSVIHYIVCMQCSHHARRSTCMHNSTSLIHYSFTIILARSVRSAKQTGAVVNNRARWAERPVFKSKYSDSIPMNEAYSLPTIHKVYKNSTCIGARCTLLRVLTVFNFPTMASNAGIRPHNAEHMSFGCKRRNVNFMLPTLGDIQLPLDGGELPRSSTK
jgi:hypothetical protein